MTYTRYDIHSDGFPLLVAEDDVHGRGPVVVRCETDDDNDDGYPDNELTVYFLRFPTVEAALKSTGSSRRGLYGQPVDVYLDGEPA